MTDTTRPQANPTQTVTRSMAIVMFFTLVGKITGFLRETVLASQYGLNEVTDAFKVANDLPGIFLSVIVTALAATLIPVYSSRLKKSQQDADRFINNLLTAGILLSVLVLVVTTLLLEPLVTLLMPGASASTRALTEDLARIMMPMGLFVFLARAVSAFLQANFRFTMPAISQFFLNLCVIVAILVSAGASITMVAIGSVIGWVLTLAVQIPGILSTGLKPRPVLDWNEPGIREVAILMLPVLVSSAFDSIYFVFDRAVASGVVGDISALDYSNRVSTMISSVLLTTVAIVLYPSLVKNAGDRTAFRRDITFGVNLNLLIALPATIAILLLASPIMRLVYERGKFTAQDTLTTAPVLACYCAGILGVGLRELCNRGFYANKKTLIPTVVGVSVVVLNIMLNVTLYPFFGARGIAIATAIASLVSGVTLLTLLGMKTHALDIKRMLDCLVRAVVAAVALGAVLCLGATFLSLETLSGRTFLVSMLGLCAAGMFTYAVVLWLLKTEEITLIISMVRKRLKR